MNCQSIQNKILALPDPRQVPESLRDHLGACSTCQTWWQQAVRLERLLTSLPVPAAPADKKAALIDELTSAGPVIKSVPSLGRAPTRTRWTAILTTSTAKYVAALAAAILVAIGAWQLIKPTSTNAVVAESPRHPLLDKVVKRDLALAKANTPAQRLEVLGGLADDLSSETRSLARVGTPDDLDQLARWFDKVVKEGIEKQARSLPPGMNQTEKTALLNKLTVKLADAKQEADRVSRESPPQSQPALKKIVDAAQEGQNKLQAILAEGT